MLGKWSFGQFCLAEATALFIGIVQYIENEGMMEEYVLLNIPISNVLINSS